MNVKPKREGFVEDEPASGPVIDAEALPAPELEEERPREVWPIKVRLLHREVRNNRGEMLKELSFREPTGGDINRYGNPVMIDQEGNVVILEKKMTTMMAVLCGVLQPFIEGMDPRDWNSCAYRLRNFFLPDPAAW